MKGDKHGRRWLPWLSLLLSCLVGLACVGLLRKLGQAPRLAPEQRALAVGELTGLDPVLQRVFGDHRSFAPLPAPGPSDWLRQHHEPGQSYPQYLERQPNLPSAQRRTIVLQPLDDLAAQGSPPPEQLLRFAGLYFGLPVELARVLPTAELGAQRRSHQGVEQLLAPQLLESLQDRLPAHAYCLLGLTMSDLYPEPSWNFVFGMASLRGRTGVFSFARYTPSFYGEPASRDISRLLLLRSLKVLAHETGHMFGIQHCIYYLCLMNGSNHLAETDRQPLQLCPVCLRKLHYAVGFEPLARYRALAELYRELGLEEEAAQVEARLELLEP